MTATIEPEVGKSRRRKEDERLITGRTRWTDNITLPGMLHMAILRSPFAHAKIVSIDTSAAKGAAGVVAVFTGKDLDPDSSIGMPCAWPITPDMKAPRRPVLASDQVNFAGEGVAVVVARLPPKRTTRSRRSTSSTTSCRSSSTWKPRSPTAPRWSTKTRAPTRARSGSSTPARPAPAATSRTRSARRRSSSSAASASSGWSRPSWSRGPASSTRPARRSPCGRPRRSRTSCA